MASSNSSAPRPVQEAKRAPLARKAPGQAPSNHAVRRPRAQPSRAGTDDQFAHRVDRLASNEGVRTESARSCGARASFVMALREWHDHSENPATQPARDEVVF